MNAAAPKTAAIKTGPVRVSPPPSPAPWITPAAFLMACATLAAEIILTRVFSVLMWYHFAFLAVSVCLFGLGAGSLVVHLAGGNWRAGDLPRHLGRCAIGFALAQLACVGALRLLKLGSLDLTPVSILQMGAAFLVAALPFTFSGAFFALVFSRGSERIGRYYFADLAGAAAGCLATIALLTHFGGEAAMVATGAIALVAGLVVTPMRREAATWRTQLAALVVVVAVLVANHFSPFLMFRHTKGNDEPEPIAVAWNSFSRVIAYPRADIGDIMLVIDGIAFTPITPFHGDASATQDAMANLQRLPYVFYDKPSLLVIGSGGGEHILTGLSAGASEIVGIEMNPIVLDMVNRRFADISGGLFTQPGVTVELAEGRSWVARSQKKFDVVNFTLVDTWAATAGGAFSLTENYLFTAEAFGEYFDRLTPRGMVAVKRWKDAPEYIYRTVALARHVLDARKTKNVASCFYVVRDGDFANVLIKPSGFSVEEVLRLEDLVKTLNLEIMYSPYMTRHDETLESMLRAANLDAWVAAQEYDYSAPTDDHPFFFYTLRPADLLRTFSQNYAAKIRNIGALIVFVLAALVFAFVSIMILGPLVLVRRHRVLLRGHLRAASYFGLIGLGYLTVEIAMMQSFILYLGHPTLTLSVFLATLLVMSGIGAGLSSRIGAERPRKSLALVTVALVGVAVGLLIVAPKIFAATLGADTPVRIAVSIAMLAPLGILMGLFFPMGVRAVRDDGTVPWMFAVNSAASVFGSVAAMAIALLAGFSATVTFGLAAYVVAAIIYPSEDE